MKKYFSHYSVCMYLLLVGVSFLLFHFTFFNTGFPMSHDGTHHLVRSAHYFQLLNDGQFLPYWDGYMNSGFGSPLFNYVPPLVYMVSSIFQAMNVSVIDSLKIVIVIFNIIFFVGSYKVLKLFFNSHVSLLATIILFFSPYRISQVFVRGALPEFAALSLTPLFLFFLCKGFKGKLISVNNILAALILHLVFVAHTLFAIQLCLALGFLLLAQLFKRKFLQFFQLAGIIVSACVLSAFLYLPILFELQYVQIFLTDAFPPHHHFSAWWQLFDPGWGLGFSMPGTNEDGMSFQLGAFHWLLVATATWFLIKDKITATKNKIDIVPVWVLLALLVTLLLQITSPMTKFLYEHVSIFHRQQFPWRFLNLSILLATYLGATALQRFKLTLVMVTIASVVVFMLSSYYLRPGVFLQLSDQELLSYNSDTTFSHEYTPIGRDSTAEKEYVMTDPAYVVEGDAEINGLTVSSAEIALEVTVPSDKALLRLNTMYFPGLKVSVDDVESEYTVLTKKDLLPAENRDVTNLLQISVPEGQHTIRAFYEPTKWRKIGTWITASTYVLFIAVLCITKFSQGMQKTEV